MKIILLGPQGGGKGTQADALSKKFNVPHISTGQIFRTLTGSLKTQLDGHMLAGELVPDALVMQIFEQRVAQPDCSNGYILDGFPRTLAQAEALDKITKIDWAFEVYISDDEAVSRLGQRLSCPKCGAIFHGTINPPKITNRVICQE